MSVVPAAQNPGFFERYWPAPPVYASRRALAGVLGAGLVGALTLTLSRPGLGWLLVGLAVGGAAAIAAPVRGFPLASLGWAGATVALRVVPVLRDDGWLAAYCLLAALGTGSVALAGGRTLKGLFIGGLAAVVAVARAVPWVGRGVAAAGVRRPGGPRLGRSL